MKEQTKVSTLLLSVIIVAILSLLFVFYSYSKIQTKFTARVLEPPAVRIIEQAPLNIVPEQPHCSRPHCLYQDYYRIGATQFMTGELDINGENMRGCHPEQTELHVKVEQPSCFVQVIKCISGGWTLASSPKSCL